MALTADQLTDMQGELGITADGTVFTDTELNRLFTRAAEDYNTAVYLGYRQLLADANKFFDYRAGQTSVSRSQVRKHLFEMLQFWQAESRVAGNQLAILGLASIPPKWKDEPISPDRDRLRRGALGDPDVPHV